MLNTGEAMQKSEVVRAWGTILTGRVPSLSIEITKECPLRCPGCYAFDSSHLGGSTVLQQLSDFKGDELVRRILFLLDECKPLHVSLVGGDPLVRYRELEQLIPQIESRGIHTQIVTSAFRVIPAGWSEFKKLNIVISIDGLQPEHDERRKPATYERILKNIAGSQVTIHSTITSQIASRPGYLEEFVAFWSANPAIRKIWFSLFTPQKGANDPEILTPSQRHFVTDELRRLRLIFSKLDMDDMVINEMAAPPRGPEACIFARTTQTVSADLKTQITPCQFGGNPDCSQCGCIASMGLAAVGHYKVVGGLTAGHLFSASERIGRVVRKMQRAFSTKQIEKTRHVPFNILQN
jgi:MoaA/NifB/PqqE/SkfB family radical SAM enzyme